MKTKQDKIQERAIKEYGTDKVLQGVTIQLYPVTLGVILLIAVIVGAGVALISDLTSHKPGSTFTVINQ